MSSLQRFGLSVCVLVTKADGLQSRYVVLAGQMQTVTDTVDLIVANIAVYHSAAQQ
ncbi:hypothetical protein D3C72_1984640 [compost metagenome]